MSNDKDQLSYDQIISLLSIYENEWEHRNNILWSQIFRFFYISVFTMILPNITTYLSISLPQIPLKLFPAIGILIATLSYILSISYSKRLEASSRTYNKLNDLLPDKYRRIGLETIKHGKYFKARHTVIIPFFIYLISLTIGITLLFVQ